ncbi:Hypothetical protein SMAX5B_007644, partial [Scophthalmus maximus]
TLTNHRHSTVLLYSQTCPTKPRTRHVQFECFLKLPISGDATEIDGNRKKERTIQSSEQRSRGRKATVSTQLIKVMYGMKCNSPNRSFENVALSSKTPPNSALKQV